MQDFGFEPHTPQKKNHTNHAYLFQWHWQYI